MAAANEISVNGAAEAALSQLKPRLNCVVFSTKKKDAEGFSLFSRLGFALVWRTRVRFICEVFVARVVLKSRHLSRTRTSVRPGC